jgi:hypothetical protein
MIKLSFVTMTILLFTSASAWAVSLMDVIGKCGDDAKTYCQGVGYGDPMTACLAKYKVKLKPDCRLIVDRIEAGDRVSLF